MRKTESSARGDRRRVIRRVRVFGAALLTAAASVAALVPSAPPAHAAIATVVPSADATNEAIANNAYPWDCGQPLAPPNAAPTSLRYQQVYAGGEVGSFSIGQLAFRQDAVSGTAFGPTVLPNVRITLSTTSKAVNALDPTFANNVGADVVTVFSGDLTLSSATSSDTPRPFDVVIPFQRPFDFNASAGNLLVDVTISACRVTTFFDADAGGTSTSRLYSASASAATGSADPEGLVTQFSSASANLSVKKTGPATAAPGANITYTVTISNAGPQAAETVNLLDFLPAGTALVSVTPPTGWACPSPPSVAPGNNGAVQCTTSTFDVGSVTFSIVAHVSPTASGSLTNTAWVASPTPDPDSNNNVASSSATAVTCDHVLSGSQSGNLTLSGGTWCLRQVDAPGNVSVASGTTAVITASRISGTISASGGGALSLCGSTVNKNVNIAGATGFVLIGDPGNDACPGNSIGGNVSLATNHAGVEVSSNRSIGGNLSLSSNQGGGPFPGDAHPEVEANAVTGNLACTSDTPTATNNGHPNTVHGTRSGECGAPGF